MQETVQTALRPETKKAMAFLDEMEEPMNRLREVCKEYGLTNVKKIFVFTVDSNEYRLFVDYEALEAEFK